MASRQIALTLYGVSASGIAWECGESVALALTCQDPSTRLPLVLTGGTLRLSVCAVDILNQPTQPPAIATTATITDAVNGLASVAISPGASSALAPGGYFMDCFFTDASGNRLALLTLSRITLTAAATLP